MDMMWTVPGWTMCIDNVKDGGEDLQGTVVNALMDVDLVYDGDVGVFSHKCGQSAFAGGCFWCM
eukprot:1396440-Amphidinium_carterae.2